MFVVHRSKGKIVKGHHHIYTKEEADEQAIRYCYWRDGRAGDWVLTDDGYVLECLGVREYFDKGRSNISRIDVYTTFFYYGCARITHWMRKFVISKHLRGMNTLDGKSWQERFVSSKKGRAWIKLAAAMMLDKTLDHMELGEFMGFDRKYPDSTLVMVKRYLRDNLIESAIILQMSQYLKDKGVTADSVLEDYKKIKDSAIRDGKYSDAIKILEKMERWTGLNQKIDGDKIEHGPGQDLVGSRIEQMIAEGAKPKELIGGGRGLKIPASVDSQVFDENGNRLEYVKVEDDEG